MSTLNELKSLTHYSVNLARVPVSTMKNLPPASFQSIILFQVLVSALFGAFTGVVTSVRWHSLLSVVAFPIIVLFLSFILSLTLSLTFRALIRRKEPFEKIYRLVFAAILPYIVFYPIVSYLPPMFLVSCLLSCLLLVVGLVESFHVPKNLALKVVAVIAVIFFVVWVVNQIQDERGLGELSAILKLGFSLYS